MSKIDIIDLYDLLIEQLRDLHSGVNQKQDFLKKADKMADSVDLDEIILAHEKQARSQKQRLDHVFDLLNETSTGEHSKSMKALVKSALELARRCKVPEVRDASLITSIQHIDHYELAGYGTAISYAKILKRHDIAELLLQNMNENKETDNWLSDIAESDINQNATWDALVETLHRSHNQ